VVILVIGATSDVQARPHLAQKKIRPRLNVNLGERESLLLLLGGLLLGGLLRGFLLGSHELTSFSV
jgi:hypothetical protein